MGIKEKKLLIISNFINSESARLSLENKGRSIFYFFKNLSVKSVHRMDAVIKQREKIQTAKSTIFAVFAAR